MTRPAVNPRTRGASHVPASSQIAPIPPPVEQVTDGVFLELRDGLLFR